LPIRWSIVVTEWWTIVVPLGVFAACIVGGVVIRKVFFGWLRKWQISAVIIPTLRTPILIWAVILGFDLATESSVMPSRYARPIHLSLETLWIVSLTIIAAQLFGNMVRNHSAHSQGSDQAPTLVKTLTQILVSIIGLLFLLNYLHVDIRPLLTALGVGGLAVALALQDTLSNLFAGLYISVSSQIRVGDYVKLNSGEEGYVTDITWRSTTLRALANNNIFVPNSKLAQAIVTNYNLPSRNLGVGVNVHVAFDADTDRIEELLLDEALKEKIDGLLTNPPPSVVWSPMADSSLLFSLNFQVAEFENQFKVQSELRKRIFKRFRKEGIAMPYPTQSVVIKPS
jgi:small-conductance mechanosensitive channel